MTLRALRTPLSMAVLSMLKEQPRHPYEMQALLRERHVGMVVKLRGGSLYDAIGRLERAGLVEVVQTSRSGARPEHTVYELTEAGLDLLDSLVREYVGDNTREFPVFPAGLAHILHLTPDDAAQLLRNRLDLLRSEFDEIASALKTARREGIPRVVLLEGEYSQKLRKTEITWIESVVRDIENGDLPWPNDPEELRCLP